MNDATVLRRLQRFGNLPGDVQGLTDRDRPAFKPIGQRVAFDEFKHEGANAVDVLHAVNCANVWVIQRRQQPRFALEAGTPVGIGAETSRKNFDRDLTPELPVARPVHLAHATRAKRREHFVMRKAVPDQQRRRGRLDQRGRRDETSRVPMGNQ